MPNFTPVDHSKLTLGELLCHANKNVRRHAVGILKALQENSDADCPLDNQIPLELTANSPRE